MKKIVLLFSLLIISILGKGQINTCTVGSYPPKVPITTNPSSPVNQERPNLVNSFDWTVQTWPINPKAPQTPFNQVSPFYEVDPAVSIFRIQMMV